MIKQNRRLLNWGNRLADMLLIYLAYRMAVNFWIFSMGHDSNNISCTLTSQYPLQVLLLLFGYVVLFQYGGRYDSVRGGSSLKSLRRMLEYFGLGVACDVGLLFLFKLGSFSRGVMVCFFLFGYVLLVLKQLCLRWGALYIRRHGMNRRHVLLAGDGELAARYLAELRENPDFGIDCLGYVGRRKNEVLGTQLGSFEDFPRLLEELNPDEVVLALEQYEQKIINSLIFECEAQGIKASIVPIYSEHLPASATVESFGGIRMLSLRSAPLDLWVNQGAKRLFDIAFSLLVIVLLSPVYLALAIGVRLSGPGPVFFRQTRIGLDRKPFTMLKFRSMCVNSESDTAWTGKTDARITPFGAFIRKFSLDELPQFFNVLAGSMSVIGPRPELPHFVNEYKKTVPLYMVKHQVKPGITGWAQVNGYRGDTSIEERIKYDVWYIENWSAFLDLRIVFMTAFGGMMNEEKNINNLRSREARQKRHEHK